MDKTITTIIIVFGLVLGTQVITLFAQYRINKGYKGIGYWLLGTSLMSLGYFLMPLVAVEPLKRFAIVANPLLMVGHLFLYVGIKKFLDKKLHNRLPILIFFGLNLLYYYYIFINNNIIARTIVINGVIAMISFMIVYELLHKKERLFSGSNSFIAIVFIMYGCFNLIRLIVTFDLAPTNSYIDQGYSIIIMVTASIIFSNLWTFGLIIMVNQRLTIENVLEKEKYHSILKASPDNITITNLDGSIVMVSPAGKKMFGYDQEFDDFTDMKLLDFIVPEDVKRAKSNIHQLYQGVKIGTNEYRGLRHDQSSFDIEVNSGIIYNANRLPSEMVFIIRDITKRKLLEQDMDNLIMQLEKERNIAQINADTDSLTGLYNRGYLDNMLTKEFFRLKRSRSILSLIMLDVDHFKKYNDNYGHLAGDRCLEMVANTLRDTVKRSADVVARYGGEEFVVILPETDEYGAKHIGEIIRKEIENLEIPHRASVTKEFVTVSVGIVTVNPANLRSPDQVLKLADEALYNAKEKGRNCCVYSSTVN